MSMRRICIIGMCTEAVSCASGAVEDEHQDGERDEHDLGLRSSDVVAGNHGCSVEEVLRVYGGGGVRLRWGGVTPG